MIAGRTEVTVGGNGTLRQRQLGRELRRLREDAGLTLDEAAPQLDWSTSKLSRIETGQQSVDVHGVRSMLDLYDVGGDRWTEIIDLTREARHKGWWHAYGIRDQGYLALETEAAAVREYQLGYVPGLLQTEDYMRTLFSNSRRGLTEKEIDRDVQVRRLRQRRLVQDPPLELIAVVDESALRRPIGGVDVMRAQLRRLVTRASLPSVCLQVLPTSLGAHSGLDGSFILLGFGESGEPDVAYIEHAASALHVQKETEVSACTLVFDRLRSEALSPQDSVILVERLAAEL